MSILLICRNASGTISLSAECINEVYMHERHYPIMNHHVILDGYPDAVLRHDADTLLSMPSGLYRMPTPGEQDRFMQTQRSKGMIQEVQGA